MLTKRDSLVMEGKVNSIELIEEHWDFSNTDQYQENFHNP